ncbi:MAG TPA: hypothetical protein VFM18_07150 [Methanosarcina sp.]|nr:hypothetical protein [Methanosarcina sp.]
MEISTIYFDMDEVLVNQKDGLAKLEGISPEEMMLRRTKAKEKDKHFDYIMYLIRKHIDAEPFSHYDPLPEFEYFKEFMLRCKSEGYKVEILSSGTSSKELYEKAVVQKRVWLIRHGLGNIKANFSHGSSEKKMWSCTKALLVDDYERNILEFREAGGHGVHHIDIHTSIEDLRALGFKMENF